MKQHLIYLLAAASLLFSACQSHRTYFPKDVQNADIEIVRFDSALLSLPTDSAELLPGLKRLYADFPEFMPVFSEDIIGVPAEDICYLAGMLPGFLTDTLYGFQQTNKVEQETFSDVSDIKQELDKAFGRILYLYPDFTLPRIYFFVSGFNGSLLFMEDDIAIGADMYLGSDYPYYNRVVYDYQKATMRKECIAGDVISAYLFRYIAYTSNKSRLLENMIYRGKIMYLLTQLLPDEKPWDAFGYSKEKWDWAERHENAIWRLMLDKQDLYKTETIVLTSYLNDGPFTSEISQECPARIGTWIGMRIVAAYMENHPEISLQQLMEEGDAQHILESSNYRP